MNEVSASPVSFLAHVARLPKKGMPVIIDANESQREQLARDHGLESVGRYHADLLVVPWKNDGVRVSGTVEADIVQSCIVTLELIDTRIVEDVSGLFLPEDSKLQRLDRHASSEIVLDADGPDSPETFTGDTIDVGALAEEFFALAIDPYPRKAGAELSASEIDPADAGHGQLFEKLKGLRPKS